MKPRQTMKNYHNSNVPPYQHQQNSSSSPSALRDIDLAKLGFNIDDMPNLQANPNLSTNQEEIVKCLQAIYGKNSAEILQKLPTLTDWPMQSVSPPDHQSRFVSGVVAGSSNSAGGIGACSGVGSIGLGVEGSSGAGFSSGGASCGGNVSINNNNNSGLKQDLQFNNSQHQHHINHFRISTSNLHPSQQQQQLSQQKSVLSLHQHHQNDLSNRRLNHHHMSTTNASFANLSAVNATSTPTPSTDANNLSTLAGNINCKNSAGPTGTPTQVSNIMDTLGSMDNMFYDGSMQTNKDTSSNQQSLRRQQLQKLLSKATGSQPKSSSATTLSLRNDMQPQRNITSNNMPQTHLPISSPASTISPPQAAFPSVPKSLLNLAACSSSSPTSTISSSLQSGSKFSSMVSQLNLRSARNAGGGSQTNLNNSNTNNNTSRSFVNKNTSGNSNISSSSSNNNNDAFNQKGVPNGNDHLNMIQHMTRSATSTPSNNAVPPTRSGSRQYPLSLLTDDQSSSSRSNLRTACNVNSGSSLKTPSQVSQRVSQPSASSKDAFLANLQERAARVGVSIGEMNKPVQSTNIPNTNLTSNNTTNQTVQQNTVISISPNQSKEEFMNSIDRKEIESALSRVEARNDLSLLYPPMLLASNSQKQINALSAGLQGAEDSELFTKEVKKIVLEECNIIYECKECNNLFRSLANLVKHKRTYCFENMSEHNSMEMNKRPYMNTVLQVDQPAINLNNPVTFAGGDTQQDLYFDPEQSSASHPLPPTAQSLEGGRSDGPGCLANYNSRGSERRSHPAHDSRMMRIIRNQERKNNQEQDVVRTKGQNNGSSVGNYTAHTSLSKLLQSQPKNRLPVSRDSALIGALNMAPLSTSDLMATSNSLSAFESDKNMNCPSDDVHEQLVRNSSLAKTLLNEKVRVTNPRQSLIELSKAEIAQTCAQSKQRVVPKRKFLEDCIQKVKRDKLMTEEEEGDQVQPVAVAPNSDAAIVQPSDLQQVDRETLAHRDQEMAIVGDASKMNSDPEVDSDNDSDMLMIDLDSPTKKTSPKKSERRTSTAASSTASSSSSSKLNTSSALLKALTRPVDTKRSYTVTPLPCEEKPPGEQRPQTVVEEGKPEEDKPKDDQLKDDEPKEDELEEDKSTSDENTAELKVMSPLFDRYTCDICENDYKDLAELMKHTVEKHTREKMIYPCIFCSLSFIALENVCRHIIDIHKKPKAQVHRLKEVVRSRSYMSSDFLACSDHPSLSTDEKGVAVGPSDSPSSTASSSTASSKTSSSASSSGSDSTSGSSSSSSSSSGSPATSSSSSTTSSPTSPEPVENVEPARQQASTSKHLSSESIPQTETVADELGLQSDENLKSSDTTGKHISSVKDQRTQRSGPDEEDPPYSTSNDSDSEGADAESEEGINSDSTSPQEEPDDTAHTSEQVDQVKQSNQRPSSSNKSTSESTPSSSSASGSGGIMKLKIQLKTRPDEKSKVYEIV